MAPLTIEQKLQRRQKEIQDVLSYALVQNAKATDAAAEEGAKRTRELLSRPGDYKLTRYSWGDHMSSRPGSPPAKGTGSLQNSIVAVPYAVGNPSISGFGSTAKYAIYVEFGHGGPQKAAPRPFLRTVARDSDFHKFITKTVSERWEKSMRIGVRQFMKLRME
jgi:hypothetical protein